MVNSVTFNFMCYIKSQSALGWGGGGGGKMKKGTQHTQKHNHNNAVMWLPGKQGIKTKAANEISNFCWTFVSGSSHWPQEKGQWQPNNTSFLTQKCKTRHVIKVNRSHQVATSGTLHTWTQVDCIAHFLLSGLQPTMMFLGWKCWAQLYIECRY